MMARKEGPMAPALKPDPAPKVDAPTGTLSGTPGTYDLVHQFMRGDISPQDYAAETLRAAEARNGVWHWPRLRPLRH